MKNKMRSFLAIFIMALLSVTIFSCGNKETSKVKEYVEFQTDSLKQCTQNKVLVEAAIKSAFERIAENNGYWKRDNIVYSYSDNLKSWVGIVNYRYDRNGTYFQSSVAFNIKYWAEQDGNKAKVFYTIKQIPVSEAEKEITVSE